MESNFICLDVYKRQAMFYGQGAGKEATASAVVGDVIEEAQTLGRTVQSEWSKEKLVLAELSDTKKRYFCLLYTSRCV